jgi:UDP:flavonoid glycosyltransferase YjiC (YdhE family)
MRILFSSLPLPGHSYPLIPLALAARDAGHDVRFATGTAFHRSAAAFDLEAVAAGMNMTDAFELANGGPVDHSALTPERQAELEHLVFAEILPRAFMADMGPVLEEFKPDLVVHEIANTGALLASKRAGIPGVCHNIGRVTGDFGNVSIATAAANLAAEVGIELPIPASRGGGNPLLDIYPPSLQDKEIRAMTNRIALRPVPITAHGQLPDWVAARDRDGGRPLLYVTFGTVFGGAPALRQAIEGLATMDADVLVSVGPNVDIPSLGEFGDTVRIDTSEPQAELLSHVDLVVHHGGTGLTLGALTNGAPQLVLPQGIDQVSNVDQLNNAEAVAAGGVGAMLIGDDQTADTIKKCAQDLLSDNDARIAARAVAVEIAEMPSPAATVAVLVEESGRSL